MGGCRTRYTANVPHLCTHSYPTDPRHHHHEPPTTLLTLSPHRVEVGGGRLQDALQQLAAQPTLWALLAGIAVNVAQVRQCGRCQVRVGRC